MAQKLRQRNTENNKVHEGMEHLILCEGLDARNFLIYYLNSQPLSDIPAFSRTFQVEDFGGNEELPTQIQLWTRAPGFNQLKSVLVIRDAETSSESASQHVIHAFKDAGLPVPEYPCQITKGEVLQTGFALFPSFSELQRNGTLEDLCLSILEETEKPVLDEINLFICKLKDKELRSFPRKFKTRLHTYFSITDNYVSLKIGEAAKAGAFNWESPKLSPLKSFLYEVSCSG